MSCISKFLLCLKNIAAVDIFVGTKDLFLSIVPEDDYFSNSTRNEMAQTDSKMPEQNFKITFSNS